MLKGLHHSAYRCRDSEETRKFYEDFLGLPLVAALEIGETKTGRMTQALHTFCRMDNGSCIAFFEAGIETRGVSDHRFIHSIYFRDPNGYVVELTAKAPGHDEAMDRRKAATQTLAAWQERKAHVAA